jgi:hypothetical protein
VDICIRLIIEPEKVSIFLKIANGGLDVKVNDEVSLKMKQITKKMPPSKTAIQMIFTELNERKLSSDYNKTPHQFSEIYSNILNK